MFKPVKIITFHSIKIELIFWLLLLSLIPITLVAWISYQQASQGLTNAAKAQLTQSAESDVRFIQNWFDYRFMDLKNHSNDNSSILLIQSLSQAFQSSGLSLANYINSEDWAERVKFAKNELADLKTHYDYIYDLFLIDKKGNILYTVAGEADLGTNLLQGTFADTRLAISVRHSLKTGQAYFSDLERYSPSNNAIAGFLTAPMRDENDQVIGVFAIQLRFERIFSLMKSSGNNAVKNFLIAEDGGLRTPLQNDLSEVLTRKLSTQQIKLFQREHSKQGYKTNNANEEALIYTNYQGVDIIGIHHVVNLPGVHWYLISEIEEARALAPAIWLANIVLWLVLLVGSLVVIVSIYIARRFTHPIEELSNATQAFTHGKLDIQIAAGPRNEIGRLAEAFNQMIIKRRLFEYNIEVSHQQATQALAKLAEQKYALDQHSIVSITDIDGAITYVNDKFCAISGYAKAELMGQNHRMIKSGLHDDNFYRDLYKTISCGAVWQGDVCNKAKNGDLYWLNTTIVPFKGEANSPKSFIAIRTDITARVHSEQAVKESEQRFDMAMSVINDGIWDWNLETNLTVFDERYYTMAGYQKDEFPHQYSEWEQRVHPDDLQSVLLVTQEYKDGKRNKFEIEFRFRRKDNTYMWILAQGKFFAFDEHNNPTRMIGTHTDVTLRKKAEKALQGAQKMEAIGQLTEGIAHDFNNILCVVIGNLDLLDVQLKDNAKAHKRITAASKAAERATKLTRQLLGFSRRKAAASILVDINVSIQEMDEILRHTVGHNITLNYNFSHSIWLTEIDSGDFHDTLLNMIINARDAMPDGGKIIVESSNCVLDEAFCKVNAGAIAGEYVQLAISDEGEGIANDILSNIFEPFFTTKEQGKGTGLGLSMVFGFIKRSGGYIQVYSELNLGTTFKLYLPRSKNINGQLVVTNNLKPSVDVEDIAQLPLGTETILLVDDEEGLVDLAQYTLEQLGYKVLTASNAQQALTILSTEVDIALIFTDVIMPGEMTGFALAEKVIHESPQIKILLTSGYTGKSAQSRGLINSQFELLAKPYTQADMVIKIRQILGTKPDNLIDKNIDKNSAQNKSTLLEYHIEKPIAWKEEFSTGIEVIDNDHRQLLVLLNQCHTAVIENKQGDLNHILARLLKYTREHFKREEAIMLACDYPKFKNHQQIHQLLIKQVKNNQRLLAQKKLSPADLLDFLTQWLVDHILGLDSKISCYCEDKKTAIEQALMAVNVQIKKDNNP